MKDFFYTNLAIANKAIDNFDFCQSQIYAQFLAQTYYFVSHSTRLLALAAARFPIEQEELHHRFIQHISEEKGHHLIALKDLENLGYDIHTLPELYSTRLLYEPQYYKCAFLDPTAFFGYILALEGIASIRGRSLYPAITEKYGNDKCTFIYIHAKDDQGHLESAFLYLTKLTESQLDLVKINFIQSCHAYRLFLEEIKHNPA